MIRILDGLVARSFIKIFLAFVAGAPVLFVLGDVTDNLANHLDQGLSWKEVGTAYLYMLPQFIQWSLPIAAFIAAVFTIQIMTMHREVVAAKAGGISFHRVIVPILLLGVLLTGVALGLEEVVPRANRRAAEVLRQEDFRRDHRTNFVFQGEGGRNFSVKALNVAAGAMSGVVMEEVEPGSNRPSAHLLAAGAQFNPEAGWTFTDGYYRFLEEDGSESAHHFESLQMRGFRERPEDLLEKPRPPEEMTYGEMGRLADVMIRSGGDPAKLLVDRQEKLAIPVATLVIILFGAPLATSSKRSGPAYGIGVALLSTILYILLFRVSGAVGETGAISPFIAAWFPNLLFLGAGLIFMVRVRT